MIWKLAYKAFLTIKPGGAKRQSPQKCLSMFMFVNYRNSTIFESFFYKNLPHIFAYSIFLLLPLHPLYHIGTTVERRSSDCQATVKAYVTPLLPRKKAQIYVQYYIIYLYIIYFLNPFFMSRPTPPFVLGNTIPSYTNTNNRIRLNNK